MVRVVLAGEGCSGDGDASDFHGHGHDPRQAPAGALVHETIEEKAAVRAVSMVSKVQGSERGMGQQHGTAVCFVYLGHGGASRKLTGNWSFEGVAPPS